MTWKQLTERDCREWKLSAINPHDRRTWRSGVRSAMRAASQLSGRGPLMWMLPLYLHVNQKSDYDYDDVPSKQYIPLEISVNFSFPAYSSYSLHPVKLKLCK